MKILSLAFKNAIASHLRNDFQSALDGYCLCANNGYRREEAIHYLGLLLFQNGQTELGYEFLKRSDSDESLAKLVMHNVNALKSPQKARILLESTQHDSDQTPYAERNIGSIDDWRHLQMLSFASTFKEKTATYLTVGDHFGNDALRLRELVDGEVTPSSLSLEYLDQEKAKNSFRTVLELNAEKIALEDDAFDYVVCKEALHHMSRPYLAVYEMLRVARKAVMIVAEPCDPVIDYRPEGKPLQATRVFSENSIVGPEISYQHAEKTLMTRYIDWWETGPFNYVYTLSERELVKTAQGYGIPAFAIKQTNDYYAEEFSNSQAKPGENDFEVTLQQIHLQNLLCDQSGIPKSRISAVLFLEPPSENVKNELIRMGFGYSITRTRYLPIRWPNDLVIRP
jgi:ubiquinone/menaquinone biosynthesis C-methylase UbiE